MKEPTIVYLEGDPISHLPDDEGEPEKPPTELETTDLAELFGPTGAVAAVLDGYESRPGQLGMAQVVKEAILERQSALVEAPTGTGKSIAYLLPALLSGRTVVIATANKSLQSQLYNKDIPFLSQVLGREIEAVLVKGRSNFVCNYKWERESWEQQRIALYDKEDEQVSFLRDWLPKTETGDVDDLPFVLAPDLRPRIVSFPDDCLHQDCRFSQDDCYVNWMRERARSAQVLITNHHLLLNALELGEAGRGILPEASIYVIDEAHQLEDIATSVFEVELSNYAVDQLLSRSTFKEHVDEDRIEEIRMLNTLAFNEIERLSEDTVFTIEEDLELLKKLATSLRNLQEEMRTKNPYQRADDEARSPDDEEAEARANYELALEGLGSLVIKLKRVASGGVEERIVRYAERVSGLRHISLRLHAAPIDPGGLLAEFLFGHENQTVICTSATLATNGHFEHFRTRCGAPDDGFELIVDPVFDYANQALLYQPALPAYNWRDKENYYTAVAAEIERLLEVSRGRALCLFTNWGGLQQVSERLDQSVWPIRAQGDAPRNALLDWFVATPYSVLLATKSFWEGVDLPGEDLSLVVLDKMPFPTPYDPLHSARMKQMDAEESGSSFSGYMLPLMTLTLKQGFGRLIRRRSDRGVVAILDERLSSKGYGRRAQKDLPPAQFSRNFRDVSNFYREALQSQADFGLNVRASERDGRIHWHWRLLRMQDGKADSGEGVYRGSKRTDGEIEGAIAALENLHSRIDRAGRRPQQFGVEIRLSSPTAEKLSKGEISNRLQKGWINESSVWRSIDILGLDETEEDR